ncbi:hypothetical protein BS78_01G126400 [Paspalum vaginatum]|nr:hypothetical protein BS78_01G126400 [Paspalum vaginatum]
MARRWPSGAAAGLLPHHLAFCGNTVARQCTSHTQRPGTTGRGSGAGAPAPQPRRLQRALSAIMSNSTDFFCVRDHDVILGVEAMAGPRWRYGKPLLGRATSTVKRCPMQVSAATISSEIISREIGSNGNFCLSYLGDHEAPRIHSYCV